MAKLKGSPSADVEEVQTGTWEMFGMNSRLPPFDEPKVPMTWTSSHRTRRWRKADSNPRSRREQNARREGLQPSPSRERI
jgi:aminopeptidase N